MKRVAFGLLSFTICGFAHADSFEAATKLGTVLASEEDCALVYNQDAITAWIEKNVADDDMSFQATLNMMTEGTKIQNKENSLSQKTARCAQTKRVAKKFKFIE